jgi:hypothetical protein
MFLCPSSGFVPPFFNNLAVRMEEFLMSFKSLSHLEEDALPEWLASSPEIQHRLHTIASNTLRHGVCWREVHRQCAECSTWVADRLYPLNATETQNLAQFFYGMVAQQCAAAKQTAA